MVEYSLDSVSSSNMASNVSEVIVDTKAIEGSGGQDEKEWQNPKFTQYLGYYKQVPEAKAIVDVAARWTIGDGYSADAETTAILDHITGCGIDTFDDILENMDSLCRINGDSFAEIIRDKETGLLINLKVLDPGIIKIVYDKKGRIKKYKQTSRYTKDEIEFSPEEILHFSNNRLADEIHGSSIYESVERIILALNESFEDSKTLAHRNVVPLRIIEADTDDPAKLAEISRKYENTVKYKEVFVVPKGSLSVITEGLSSNATFNPLPWRETLKNQLYQLVGIPQILMGSAAEFSESSAKIAYLSFEQTIKQRQRYIITQVWNQLQLKIDISFPTTLQNEMISDQKKDGPNGQMGFQPSDMIAGRGK